MDELLYERVKQLKEIDDRLERMLLKYPSGFDQLRQDIHDFRRNELAPMIQEAERQHAEF